jgi:hypothetical protein
MAKDSEDAKPTVEDVDRMIHDHERRNSTDQDTKAVKDRIAQGQEASTRVHFKKGESLWDRAGREIDAAEKQEDNKKG